MTIKKECLFGNKTVRQSKRGIIFREGPKEQQSGMQFELISKAIWDK